MAKANGTRMAPKRAVAALMHIAVRSIILYRGRQKRWLPYYPPPEETIPLRLTTGWNPHGQEERDQAVCSPVVAASFQDHAAPRDQASAA